MNFSNLEHFVNDKNAPGPTGQTQWVNLARTGPVQSNRPNPTSLLHAHALLRLRGRLHRRRPIPAVTGRLRRRHGPRANPLTPFYLLT